MVKRIVCPKCNEVVFPHIKCSVCGDDIGENGVKKNLKYICENCGKEQTLQFECIECGYITKNFKKLIIEKIVHCTTCHEEFDVEFCCPICKYKCSSIKVPHGDSYYHYRCPNCTVLFGNIDRFCQASSTQTKKNLRTP